MTLPHWSHAVEWEVPGLEPFEVGYFRNSSPSKQSCLSEGVRGCARASELWSPWGVIEETWESDNWELVCCLFEERDVFPEFLLIPALLIFGGDGTYRGVQSAAILPSPLVSVMAHGNSVFPSLSSIISEKQVFWGGSNYSNSNLKKVVSISSTCAGDNLSLFKTCSVLAL